MGSKPLKSSIEVCHRKKNPPQITCYVERPELGQCTGGLKEFNLLRVAFICLCLLLMLFFQFNDGFERGIENVDVTAGNHSNYTT